MNKHTPGPWTQDEFRTINANGKTLMVEGVALSGRIDEETRANARLIAAAPELLAALQGLLKGIFDGPADADAAMLIAKARDAVNKATGA
jgi:hypothetical protein